MPLFAFGPAGDAFAGGFGGVAALILVGGPVLLRWQKNRQQHQLAEKALAQGITQFPKGQPYWLVSKRQGVVALALGVSLLITGLVTAGLTQNATLATVEVIDGAATQPTMVSASIDRPSPGLLRIGPPAPNPALEEWHRVKAINSLGLIGTASGFILLVLGVTKLRFAETERRYEPGQETHV